jgi:NADH-quinone oxidoreductase subunit M
MPGLNSFIGEFLIIGGAFETHLWLGIMAIWGVALGTTYLVWLYYRVAMGNVNPVLEGLKLEINVREIATLAPLAFLVVCLGIYPDVVLSFVRETVDALVSGARTR